MEFAMNRPENSSFSNPDIHCPYCWAELIGVEKFLNYYFYKFHTYEKMVALPIENSEDYFNLNWFGNFNSVISSLNGDQKIMQIGEICPCCGRQYTLLVRPYERNEDERSRIEKIFTKFENSSDRLECQTIIERTPFIFNWKSDWITFILSFWMILLLNSALLIFINVFIIVDFETNKQLIIDFFSLTTILAIFIVILKRQSNIVNNFGNFNDLPYLLHPNYKNSLDYKVFQKLILNGISYANKLLWPLIVFTLGFTLALILTIRLTFGLGNIVTWYVTNNLNFSLILSFFTFFMYFFVISFIAVFFVFMSIFTLTIFTRSIPIRINPFEKSYGLKFYEDFLFFAFIISSIVSIVIPICINIESLNLAITGVSVSSSKYATLLTHIQSGYFLYVILMAIPIFSFPMFLLRVTSRNISVRKSEMMKDINEKISTFRQRKYQSNKDKILISVLLREHEIIDKIPEYPINKMLLLLVGGLIYLIPILIRLII
jgi:hypothetical protein